MSTISKYECQIDCPTCRPLGQEASWDCRRCDGTGEITLRGEDAVHRIVDEQARENARLSRELTVCVTGNAATVRGFRRG